MQSFIRLKPTIDEIIPGGQGLLGIFFYTHFKLQAQQLLQSLSSSVFKVTHYDEVYPTYQDGYALNYWAE